MIVGIYDESFRGAAEAAYPDAEIMEIVPGGTLPEVDVAYLPAQKAALRRDYQEKGATIITGLPEEAGTGVFDDPYESEIQTLVALTEDDLKKALADVDDEQLVKLGYCRESE